jgi:predicted ATPase
MSLRERVEDAFLVQFADNERQLTAERARGKDAALIAKYEALRAELMPIVTEIVAKRGDETERRA